MPILIDRQRIAGDIAGEVARLKSLAAALERIIDGEMPSEQELATAPLLDPYAIGTRTLPCLVGTIHDHPSIKGSLARTSEVWAMAPELGWARTYTRLYRLGEPVYTQTEAILPQSAFARCPG